MTATLTRVPEVKTSVVPFEVLKGHTSFETAIEVDDYPYGTLRTKIRYWVETATKGAKKGDTRFMSCTLNPKTGRWNKPHGGTYSLYAWMYRDPRTGYVECWGLSEYDIVKGIAKLKAVGVWGGLDPAERDKLMELDAYARKGMSDYYAEWDAAVAAVRDAVAAHGTPADLYDVAGLSGAGGVYKSDFDLALALIKSESGEYTLPDLKK